MARCPDCNKFVSDEVNEDVEPDFTKATGVEVGGSTVEETFTITDEHGKGEFEDY